MEERTIWTGTPSHWLNIRSYAAGLLIVPAVAILLYAVGAGVQAPMLYVWYAVAALTLIPFVAAVVRWFRTRFTRYTVTSERVMISEGVFTRRSAELELYRVKDYTLEQPFCLRLVRRGNLTLNSSDKSDQLFTLRAVPFVEQLRNDIRNAVEAMRDRKRVREVDYESSEDTVA
jgi:uncharacterized membrane protein YdbT with pleckstrin-like domain